MFISALNSMLSLFACMLIGFVCVRKKLFQEEMNVAFNKLLLNITVPAMFISAMNVEMDSSLLKQGLISVIAGFVYHFICLLIAYVTMKGFRVKEDFKSIWLFALTFANISFLGFPLIKDVFGEEMLFHATLFNISFSVIVFSIGILIINVGNKTKITIKDIVMQPGFIAVIIGIIIFIIPWPLPTFISKVFSMFGAITAPLSMFVVGATLATTSVIKAFKNKWIYIFSFVKLLVIPVVIYFIANLVVKDADLVLMFMLLSATPSAVLTVILAKRYNSNEWLASEVVFITTAISVITLPLLLKIFS